MEIKDVLIEQFNLRIYEESVARIFKVLELIDEDEVWFQLNVQTNSVGTLIVHLCGNVTQWIGSGIGKATDGRKREEEFSEQKHYSKQELKEKLLDLKSVTDKALVRLSNENLLEECEIQGFRESQLSILIHVIEHFSYHTGQIAYIAKSLLNKDLGFYQGINLNTTGVK